MVFTNRFAGVIGLVVLGLLAFSDDSECIECHADLDMVEEEHLLIDEDAYSESIHGEEGCVSCHADIDEDDLPHDEELEPVDCAECHRKATSKFEKSLHGEALKNEKYLAPTCGSCHGIHDILPASDENAPTYVMNIPKTCGTCHKLNTPVSKLESVAEKHALEDYSQSIHGDGLFHRGLVVTAVCTSCHSSHDILPHEDPNSTINRDNIAKTCMQCHRQIEKVHVKVIRQELWEKKPGQIPICVDCHLPHEIRQVVYDNGFPDSLCLSCHQDESLSVEENGTSRSLYVDHQTLLGSAHAESSCVKCHVNVDITQDPVCRDSGKVDCSMCHSQEVDDFTSGIHGSELAAGNEAAPDCGECHGTHETLDKANLHSPTYSRNIPTLCGKCHKDGEKAALDSDSESKHIVSNYSMSIHGKGLLESGLLVTATCVDCHTSHAERPKSDPLSTVHENNISGTCAQCHEGIYETFRRSVHSPEVTETDKKLPACSDCHSSHTIDRVNVDTFRQTIMNQCGNCHEEVTETYFDTFHGKVSNLGSVKTARCYDCHGSHGVLRPDDPLSTLSRDNVVATCQQCHPNSNHKFVGYLSHATHHNKEKHPWLFYTFWAMTSLLISVFTFFGLHTLMWMPRAIIENRKIKKLALSQEPSAPAEKKYIQRFDPFSRFLHLLVIVSFLSLAITGMTIKFSDIGIFQFISRMMGGYEVTGFIHRVAAVVTFLYFFLHVGHLIHKVRKKHMSMRDMFLGPNSLVAKKRDIIEFWQTIKWFLGIGPRPQYGRWTYWEKFDYYAVFWGVIIIGSSGMILWLPEFFTQMGIPGWFINVATIIHSDEALLATGFIFTVHFFNTHFRPDKFPMDTVIFTGRVSVEELKQDRPREYQEMIDAGGFEDKIVPAPSRELKWTARVFGFTALGIGLFIVILIIISMLFLYK